jgi:Secretion system C-terminal sorting domain
MKKLSFSSFLLTLCWICCSQMAYAQQLRASKNIERSESDLVFQQFIKEKILEKVSYDESNQGYTEFPTGFDITQLHFLDIPYAKETLENNHIEQILTDKGTYVTLITYVDGNVGLNLERKIKYRLILADKIVALDANREVITDSKNTETFQAALVQKGADGLAQGIFKPVPFDDLTLEQIAQLEKQGYKLSTRDNSYLFKKENIELEFNYKKLFYGETRTNKGKIHSVYRFFQEDNFGNVVPKNTHEYYDYTLPTGLEVKKSVFKIVSNVQVAGVRYQDLTKRPLEAPILKLVVSPNPVENGLLRGETNLTDWAGDEPVQCQVIDVSGKVLIQQANLTNRIFEIDIAVLPTGVFFVKMTKGSQMQSTKFVKK